VQLLEGQAVCRQKWVLDVLLRINYPRKTDAALVIDGLAKRRGPCSITILSPIIFTTMPPADPSREHMIQHAIQAYRGSEPTMSAKLHYVEDPSMAQLASKAHANQQILSSA
jgi:hypothetical protein